MRSLFVPASLSRLFIGWPRLSGLGAIYAQAQDLNGVALARTIIKQKTPRDEGFSVYSQCAACTAIL